MLLSHSVEVYQRAASWGLQEPAAPFKTQEPPLAKWAELSPNSVLNSRLIFKFSLTHNVLRCKGYFLDADHTGVTCKHGCCGNSREKSSALTWWEVWCIHELLSAPQGGQESTLVWHHHLQTPRAVEEPRQRASSPSSAGTACSHRGGLFLPLDRRQGSGDVQGPQRLTWRLCFELQCISPYPKRKCVRRKMARPMW